jgi:hypothetical protein
MSIFIGSIWATYYLSSANAIQAQNLATATTILLTTGQSAVSPLVVSSTTAYGKTFNVASSGSGSSSSNSNSYGQQTNTALIIGLVVGLVGGALLIAGSVFGFYKYRERRKGQRLIDEGDDVEQSAQGRSDNDNEHTTNQSASANNITHVVRRTSVSSPDLLNVGNNRLHSPLPSDVNGGRVPSPTVSITMLGHMTPNNQQFSSKSMPAVELIKFD